MLNDLQNNLDRQPLDWHKNCLNVVRLLAAFSVLYGHTVTHLHITMPALISSVLDFFQGVPIFFALSGMLIWNSIGTSRNFGHYAKKRILRIYPELWCAVALGLVAILILYKEPIQWLSLALFTLTQSTVLQFWTPDYLRGYGCGTPNGSLWTICVMVQFYVVAYFLYKLLRDKKPGVWLAAFCASVAVSFATPLVSAVVPTIIAKLYGQTLIPYLWLFMLGAMVSENRDAIIPFLKKWWPLFLLASALVRGTVVDIRASYALPSGITLFLGLVGFAYCFPKLNIKTDISYGVYVYHMVVVNAMIALGVTGRPAHLVVVLLVSCVLAYFSQKIVSLIKHSKQTRLSLVVRDF